MSDRKTYQKILAEQSGGTKPGTTGINKPSGKATKDELLLGFDPTEPMDEKDQEGRMMAAGQAQGLKRYMDKGGAKKAKKAAHRYELTRPGGELDTSAAELRTPRTREKSKTLNDKIRDANNSILDSYIQKRIDSLLERMMSLSEVRIPKHSGRDDKTQFDRLNGGRSRGYREQMGDSSISPKQSTQSSTGPTKPPGQIVIPTTAAPNTARDQSKDQREFGEKLDDELQAVSQKQTTTKPAQSAGKKGYDPTYLGLMAALNKTNTPIETENAEEKAAAAAKAAAKFANIQGLVSGKTKK